MSNTTVFFVGRRPSRKVIVLRDYLELSGRSPHKIVANDHFLMISDEFGGESGRIIDGISIGIIFTLRYVNIGMVMSMVRQKSKFIYFL